MGQAHQQGGAAAQTEAVGVEKRRRLHVNRQVAEQLELLQPEAGRVVSVDWEVDASAASESGYHCRQRLQESASVAGGRPAKQRRAGEAGVGHDNERTKRRVAPVHKPKDVASHRRAGGPEEVDQQGKRGR